MLPRPRVAAVDDEQIALNAIADALNGGGAACLKLLYNGGLAEGTSLEQVRVLFMDLHLSHPSGENETQHFSTIGGILLEHIGPNNGPFALIVWTLYPTQVEGLSKFLCERLRDSPHAIPTQIKTLDKGDHIKGDTVIDPALLVKAVQDVVNSDPRVAALVNWEMRVNAAASETIAAVLNLIPNEKRDALGLVSELDRLLNALATEAVGGANVGKDPFAAVNEALLPILYDRVSRLKGEKTDEKLWSDAIQHPGRKASISSHEAAVFNTMLHVDFDTQNVSSMDRGVVLQCPAEFVVEEAFRHTFGMDPSRFLKEQLCLTPTPSVAEVHWLLVQVEGLCDHAQAQAGPAPFLLAVESPAGISKAPQAVWQSPIVVLNGVETTIYVNYRFIVSFTKAGLQAFKPAFRLREAVTNDLVSRMHSYGARPGIITFREKQVPAQAVGAPAVARSETTSETRTHKTAAEAN